MAENKKSFVLYTDQVGIFDKLTDEQAGVLIKHIFKYCNDEYPEGDFVTELAFESIKQQLKRDLKKYETRANNSRENGKLGGRPKKPIKPSGLIKNPTEPKKPDTVNVTVTDNDININFSEFWNLYNKKTGRKDCEKKWNKLKDSEREEIIKTLPTYIKSTPDIQFRKNPITYLNQRTWEDELSETPNRERSDFEKYIAGEIEKPNIRMGL